MKLIVICSWCKLIIRNKDCDHLDESLPRITHSICKTCYAKVFEDLERSSNTTTVNNQPK